MDCPVYLTGFARVRLNRFIPDVLSLGSVTRVVVITFTRARHPPVPLGQRKLSLRRPVMSFDSTTATGLWFCACANGRGTGHVSGAVTLTNCFLTGPLYVKLCVWFSSHTAIDTLLATIVMRASGYVCSNASCHAITLTSA